MCQIELCDNRNLRCHTVAKHYRVGKFPCQVCGQVFETVGDLEDHLTGKHSDALSSYLSARKKIGHSTKPKRQTHVELTNGKKKCHVCQNVYASHKSLSVHLHAIHGTTYPESKRSRGKKEALVTSNYLRQMTESDAEKEKTQKTEEVLTDEHGQIDQDASIGEDTSAGDHPQETQANDSSSNLKADHDEKNSSAVQVAATVKVDNSGSSTLEAVHGESNSAAATVPVDNNLSSSNNINEGPSETNLKPETLLGTCCPICQTSFFHNKNMIRHFNEVHNKMKRTREICSFCKKKFSKKSLAKHQTACPEKTKKQSEATKPVVQTDDSLVSVLPTPTPTPTPEPTPRLEPKSTKEPTAEAQRECKLCLKPFRNPQLLVEHLKRNHLIAKAEAIERLINATKRPAMVKSSDDAPADEGSVAKKLKAAEKIGCSHCEETFPDLASCHKHVELVHRSKKSFTAHDATPLLSSSSSLSSSTTETSSPSSLSLSTASRKSSFSMCSTSSMSPSPLSSSLLKAPSMSSTTTNTAPNHVQPKDQDQRQAGRASGTGKGGKRARTFSRKDKQFKCHNCYRMFYQLTNLSKHLDLCASGFTPAKKFQGLPVTIAKIQASGLFSTRLIPYRR